MWAQIWRKHVPPKLRVAEDVDWDALAMDFEFSGGFIKNAVLAALARAVGRQSAEATADADDATTASAASGDGSATPVISHADLVAGARAQMRGSLLTTTASANGGRDGDAAQVYPVRSLADFVAGADVAAAVAGVVQDEKARRVLQDQWGFDAGGLCNSGSGSGCGGGYGAAGTVVLFHGPRGCGRHTASSLWRPGRRALSWCSLTATPSSPRLRWLRVG